MKNYFKTVLLILFVSVQNAEAQEKRVLKTEEKNTIITSIKMHLMESYVDLSLSKKMVHELDKNFESDKYKKITSPAEFAKIISEDIQGISNDLHLKVRFEPERIAEEKRTISEETKLETEKKVALQMSEINYGFAETKILDGNIGYLNLRLFADIKYAEETAASAMNFLSNTNAIIIDLRSNAGGVSNMMQLLSSYFFDETPVLLSDFYERKTDTKTQLYSLATISGKRSTNKPIYILTSKHTFSAAEAFAYTLQNFDKAVLVGELTKGGANRTKRINLNDEFTMSVPYIQAVHPITKTNWEGKGVHPNIETNEKEAFVRAYIEAINKTIKSNKNMLFNRIGYAFLKENSVRNAIKVFEENIQMYPDDANAWDSLAEAYFINGDKENALRLYRKALELNPSSKSANAMIQKLTNER